MWPDTVHVEKKLVLNMEVKKIKKKYINATLLRDLSIKEISKDSYTSYVKVLVKGHASCQ